MIGTVEPGDPVVTLTRTGVRREGTLIELDPEALTATVLSASGGTWEITDLLSVRSALQ